MTTTPRLCLGTVQFGLPYGVTNQVGQVSETEVRQILSLAASSGIDLLDTAQGYGNSESVLGRNWPKTAPCQFVSKLAPGASPESWEENFLNTLHQLKTTKVDGFLLHRASDLLTVHGDPLLDWLEDLRDRGLADRIGVSIYEASDLDGLPLDRLQLIQLPLSIYDQRLIRDGTVAMLLDLGIAVHVRSVLLQGLLLQSPNKLPDYLSSAFRYHHSRWLEHLHQKGLSPLAGALGFVKACEGIEAVLVGVLSSQELVQILQAWNQAEVSPPEVERHWAWESINDVDPRCWPS